MLPPVILSAVFPAKGACATDGAMVVGAGVAEAKRRALEHLNLTHESKKLQGFAGVRLVGGEGPSQGF